MAVKIRLKRMGKIRQPYYRIVVADSRTKRDGRVIEEIGKYHPKADPSFIEVDSERAQYWLGVGAQPSEPVTAILKVTGDWQKFKGEAAPEPMKVAEPKRDKAEIFNDALKDAQSEPKTEATTPRKSTAKKAAPAEPKADAETAEVEETVAEVESADAAAPVEQAAPIESEAAAEGAEAGDAPEGAAAETPAEETPAEETPAEETPAEETPAEAPADETATDEKA